MSQPANSEPPATMGVQIAEGGDAHTGNRVVPRVDPEEWNVQNANGSRIGIIWRWRGGWRCAPVTDGQVQRGMTDPNYDIVLDYALTSL